MNANFTTPIKIVLADDDEDDRQFFKEAIENIAIPTELKIFKDGHELLSGIKHLEQIPDILFLDLNMPKLSGLESLKEIRNIEQFKRIPIIAIYSTSSDIKDTISSYDAGANAYITKPSSYDKLKSIIEKVLKTDWDTWNNDEKNFIIN